MRRPMLLLGLALAFTLAAGGLPSCFGPPKPCNSDGSCPSGSICDVASGQCVLPEGVCTPECSAAMECVFNRCRPRYGALQLTAPVNGALLDGGVQTLTAALELAPGRARRDPPQIAYDVSGPGGAVVSSGTLSLVDVGSYSGTWTPAAEGEFTLFARYDENGLVSPPVTVTVDRTPPTFTLEVPPTPERDGGSNLIVSDPSFPGAWRRDEQVTLTGVGEGADIVPDSVRLTVVGIGDGGTPGLPGAPMLLTPFPCTSSYCGRVDVPLWAPQMKDFRGNFSLVLTGTDRVGNIGMATAPLPVTRWKWQYPFATQRDLTTPAIGASGRIYIGTSNLTSGLTALNPAGAVAWQRTGEDVQASPAVGAANGGEKVYFGTTAGKLYAVLGAGGLDAATPCTGGGSMYAVRGGVAVAMTEGVESAAAVDYRGSTDSVLTLIRPGATLAPCPVKAVTADIANASAVVAMGSNFFFPDTQGKIHGYEYMTGSVTPLSGWPVTIDLASRLSALAVVGARLVGGASSRLYARDIGTGDTWQETVTGRAFAPAVANGDFLFAGDDNSRLLTAQLDQPGHMTVVMGMQVEATPVLGEGGLLYTSDTGTTVRAWRLPGPTPEWELTRISTLTGALAIDCGRDGTGLAITGAPGVLYVPTRTGLYAAIVDSRGLDTTAPWPKYQHDPRNTGNPSTLLGEFTCP